MAPALHAVLGPLKGTSIALTEQEVSIGRDRSNQVPIPDLHLSRRHCSIKQEGDGYKIIDLNSRNGVLLNGIPVRERVLQHGDRIEVGTSLFVFVTHEDVAPSDAPLSDEILKAGSTVSIRWDATSHRLRDPQELSLLLTISSAIATIRELDSLGKRLLELISDIVPFTRGAFLILQDGSDQFKPVCQIVNSEKKQSFRINRKITEQVIRERSAVLVQDVQLNDSSDRISSLLCVPFVMFNEVLGVMYLDTFGSADPFHESHLQLVNAIAGIATPAIKNIQDLDALREKGRQLLGELRMERKLVGESPAMKKVSELIGRIAGADTTVLIAGESGTGKELAARCIHENSRRSDQPFVAINCAALPESLIESELFGHEKGAFTGAILQKQGKLEVANGGTLFLDEIAELAPALQAKLLRVLQEREFERVGGTRTIKTDIRLLAATNKDLEKLITEGTFRSDLYYRLNVLTLKMPPLRDLGDDILLLARYFVSRFNQKLPRRVGGISPEAQNLLRHYDWPGNVRELENAIERAILLGSTDVILPEDLPEYLIGTSPSGKQSNFHEALNEYKKELILKAFEGTNLNYNEAASKLGIHHTHLYRLVRNLKLNDVLKKN